MVVAPTEIMKTNKSQEKIWVLLLSWLIPGYGFIHNKHWKRGLFFFVVLQLTFLIGAFAFKGLVMKPELPGSESFNVVALLTFIVQMFNGGLALLSLLPDLFGRGLAVLPYQEDYSWADLGAFYMLVAGGMNYFVLMSTYDNFYREEKTGLSGKKRYGKSK